MSKSTRPVGDAAKHSPSRFNKLSRVLRNDGITGVSYWGSRWLYWNTPVGDLAKRAGKPLRAHPVRDPIIVYQKI